MPWKVALCQMDVRLGDPEANRLEAGRLLRRAGAAGAAVAVLPELWTTAYALDRIRELAEPPLGPTITWLQDQARELGLHLVAGSTAELRDGRVFNTAHVIDREGRLLASYDKIHLFGLMEEDRYLAPGRGPQAFRLDGIPCGVEVCYDLRFPELARTLALAGAQVLFVPAEWPEPRLSHWRSLLIARAIENQAFVVGVNRVGMKDPVDPASDRFFGHSLAVDPWGEVLAEGGSEPEVLLVDLDPGEVSRVRSRIPVFQDRRPSAYRAPGAPPLGE